MASMYKRKTKRGDTDYIYWVVDVGPREDPTGKGFRKNFKTDREASAFLVDWKRKNKKYGEMSTALSLNQQSLAVNAYEILKRGGITDDTAILQAVSDYVKEHQLVTDRLTLEQAKPLYVARFNENQHRHAKLVRYYLDLTISIIGAKTVIADINEGTMRGIIDELKESKSLVTVNTYIVNMGTFFRWCVEHHYHSENPMKNIQRLRVAYSEPVFIKADKLAEVLHLIELTDTISPERKNAIINFFTLSFFCGIRSSEIFRLTPEVIRLDEETPHIHLSKVKGAALGRKGRNVELEDNAIAWLKKYPFTQQLAETKIWNTKTLLLATILKDYAKDLSKNVGRHSFITYHCAKYHNYALTEAIAGTGAAMREKNYQGLTTTAQGNAYFNIFPLEWREP